MKNAILLLAAAAIFCSTIGCANGPIRRLFRGATCNSCQPPAPPNIGMQGDCSSGTCSSYMNDSYIQNDPYMKGSNAGNASINVPVFDSSDFQNSGGIINSPGASGILPGPTGN